MEEMSDIHLSTQYLEVIAQIAYYLRKSRQVPVL